MNNAPKSKREETEALVLAQPVEVEVLPIVPSDLLSVIARVVADPHTDIEKMERLLAMHERITAEQRKQAFATALSLLQAELPQINKAGKIIVKGTERSRYARIEDIDRAIKPLLSKHGFALSFDTESADSKLIKISCKLSHSSGYSETKNILLPLDASDYRSNVQSVGSTVSYGRRQLIKMHLNMIERGEDDDGAGGSKLITKEQAEKLQKDIAELRVNLVRFLALMGTDKLENILSRDWQKAVTFMEARRRG